jgi:hypothetical protein
MSDVERYSRQERLAEVGLAGQEKLRRARAVVRAAAGADVECAYLAAAGVHEVVQEELPAEPFAHADAFHFGPARDVGAGAWRALGTLRQVLGIGSR